MDVAPGVDFVESDGHGLGVADVDHLDWVIFLPGLFVESQIILEPRAIGIYVVQIGQYLEIEQIIKQPYFIRFYSLITRQHFLHPSTALLPFDISVQFLGPILLLC